MNNRKMVNPIVAGLVLISCTCLLLFTCNVKNAGYANNISDIFNVIEETNTFVKLDTVGKLYYNRTGYLSNWELTILGRFSGKTIAAILYAPTTLELPAPMIRYDDQYPISSFRYRLQMPPKDIADHLMLVVSNQSNIESKIDDNIIFFEGKNALYLFNLYVFGKDGYFILFITHTTR